MVEAVNRRLLLSILSSLMISLPSVEAHRLDEYLQASRIALGTDRIEVEIDLAPGIDTAARVLGLVDLDGDGTVSAVEGEAYADLVRGALSLRLDGKVQSLKVLDAQFPAVQEMKDGTGMIRLRMGVVVPSLRPGRHRVEFTNGHQPELSVYLSNTLKPADDRIEVTRQRRDTLQRGLVVDFKLHKPRPAH